MSDLHRSFAKAQLAKLPAEVPLPLPSRHPIMDSFDEREEEDESEEADGMGGTQKGRVRPLIADEPGVEGAAGGEEHGGDDADLSSSSSSVSSTGTVRPSVGKGLFERPRGSASQNRLAPLPWNDFFDRELFLKRDISNSSSSLSPSKATTIVHHAYFTPPTVSSSSTSILPSSSSSEAIGPLFVTHHGAGSSGLSFANFTRSLRNALPDAGVLSLDARGHGLTTESPEPVNGVDYGLSTLSDDLGFVVDATRREMGWKDLPDIILIGHSLGGAVTTDLAEKGFMGTKLLGYAVLDVVEGSALDALQSMETYLSTRPTGFPSLAAGIDWHSRSRTIRNITSARVSVPALLENRNSGTGRGEPTTAPAPTETMAPNAKAWIWRTDLSSTKPFWESWFTSLSSKFLTASPSAGKLLLLAGTDRLDKELIIGQMQGKYQLQVFPEAGHFIHEDQPDKTAMVLADFYHRNDRAGLVLPPKVGQPGSKW